jgi:hypothetical protein
VYGGFLALWAVALLLLAYAPVTVQRRLVEGVWVALSVLAAAGVRAIPLERSVRRLVAVGVLAISLLTSLVLLGGGILQAVRPAVPVFRPAAEVAAFEWLAEHAPPGSVVLAAFDTGNALPAWAHVRSVIGHGPETAHLEIIQPKVEAFFGGELKGSEADAFLGDRRVDYVLRGPAETALGPWETLPTNRLEPVFDDSGYVIYLVRGGNG